MTMFLLAPNPSQAEELQEMCCFFLHKNKNRQTVPINGRLRFFTEEGRMLPFAYYGLIIQRKPAV